MDTKEFHVTITLSVEVWAEDENEAKQLAMNPREWTDKIVLDVIEVEKG